MRPESHSTIPQHQSRNGQVVNIENKDGVTSGGSEVRARNDNVIG